MSVHLNTISLARDEPSLSRAAWLDENAVRCVVQHMPRVGAEDGAAPRLQLAGQTARRRRAAQRHGEEQIRHDGETDAMKRQMVTHSGPLTFVLSELVGFFSAACEKGVLRTLLLRPSG